MSAKKIFLLERDVNMKKLLSFVAVLAMALVVAPCVAKASTFYFDNTNTGWDEVGVWSWSTEDPLWQTNQGMTAWPGVALEKDDATGYYVWETVGEAPSDIAVMFNSNVADGAEQTCNALANCGDAAVGKVCVPTVKNSADDAAADPDNRVEGHWFGEWKEVGAADDNNTPDDDKNPPADDNNKDEVGDAGKDEVPPTGDVAPIAAVAVLAVASMAVVVATRKKMA